MEMYAKCVEMPLYNFVKVVITGDLYWLNKDYDNKDVSDDHQSLWDDITQEYMSLTKSSKQRDVLELLKTITAINLNIELIQSILDFMSNDYDVELVKILRSFGFLFKYDPYSDDYDRDLKMTISSAKTMIVKKKIAEDDLKKIKAETSEGNEATEQDYVALIVALSKYQGYRVDWKQVSVSEYVEMLNSFLKQVGDNGK